MSKLKMWDERAKEAEKRHPVKKLKTLPNMPGMTQETRRFFKWKAFKWLITKDQNFEIIKLLKKHPFKYSFTLLKSLFKRKSYRRDGDFFFYGIPNTEAFTERLKDPDTLVVVGFSYCHKPFECPSGRFTDACIHNPDHPVCQQCFIGKMMHALSERVVIPLFIPTVHYVGKKVVEIVQKNPKKRVLFLITACEMTLEMFGDFGNMVGIEGIGVRLDGRICNTMRAFELSEQGIKPGLTVVLDETQQRMLDLFKSS